MKGVILAGGMGTRLFPLTKVTNKHLLPVFDKPMIYYPIQCLVNAGIEDIMLVTGGNSAGDFLQLLGNGKEFGLKDISYTYQEGHKGIADALSMAEHFAEGEKIVVVLGDNIIEGNIRKPVAAFEKQAKGARILLKEVDDPKRFGVATIEDPSASLGTGGRVTAITEKPENPASHFAVIGIYMYDAHVFEFIHGLAPSARNELEITDVNNAYLEAGTLEHDVLDGWWSDAGTFESLHRVSNLIAETGANKANL